MIAFSKYQGAGNDFILIDDRVSNFPIHLVEKLCHRRLGIGADGVILLQNSRKAAFRMRIFNSDGKEAAMCGNGIRCLFDFARTLGFKEESYLVETMDAILQCRAVGDRVSVLLAPPQLIVHNLPLLDNRIDVWNTGVPHAVLFVDELDKVPVAELGYLIRHHGHFQPHGVNVNFASHENGLLRMRTYERGVEGETLACGTGAAAVALSAHKRYNLPSPLQIYASSNDLLEVNVAEGKIELIGPVKAVFHGKINGESFGDCFQ